MQDVVRAFRTYSDDVDGDGTFVSYGDDFGVSRWDFGVTWVRFGEGGERNMHPHARSHFSK